MKKTEKRYDAPQVEVIEIDYQGILCSSGGGAPATSNFTGNGGVQFGTDNGSW